MAGDIGRPYRAPAMKLEMTRERDSVSDLRPVEGPEADEDLAMLSKALGHPTRVAIVRLLRLRDGCSCTQLVGSLGLAQSTVSEHLRILRDSGLVLAPSDGGRGPYRIDVHRVRRLKALAGSL